MREREIEIHVTVSLKCFSGQLEKDIPNNVSKMANLVEGDPMVPFSIATTPRCWEGRYTFLGIAPLYP